MIRDGTQAWCGVKQKELIAHAVLYWQELISFYKRISRIILKFDFQEVAHPAGQPNRHILKILLAYRHDFVTQNQWMIVTLHHCILIYNLVLKKVWKK